VRTAEIGSLFLAGWLLMTVAMMLTTTLPLVLLFVTFRRRQAHRGALLAPLLLGYVAVWIAFGAVAYAMDFAVHSVVESSGWLHRNTWSSRRCR
jgi:predicted metal-binding membrane protein